MNAATANDPIDKLSKLLFRDGIAQGQFLNARGKNQLISLLVWSFTDLLRSLWQDWRARI